MNVKHLDKQTTDGTVRNLDALYQLFPSCFTEAPDALGEVHRAVNWQKLRALLGEYVEDGEPEVYDFTWVGKRNAQREAATPCRKTLRPCPEESVDWENTQNLYIEGDNLEVLKLLQNSYMGKVKMIYIDPPYNTGNDFVYHDDFAQSAEEYDEHNKNEEGERFRRNTDGNGRFHSDWCSMLYSRLIVARSLLTNDGLIFISIDEHESHNLRKICDEVFGLNNFISQIVWEKRYTRSNNARRFTTLTEPLLCYAKDTYTVLDIKEKRNEKADSIYTNPDNDPRGVWTSVSYVNPATKDQRPNLVYPLLNPITGKEIYHPTNAWKYEKATYEQHVKDNKLYWGKNGENTYPRLKKFLSEMDGGMVPVDLWSHEDSGSTDMASKELESLIGRKIFDFPKPKELIQRLLSLIVNGNSQNDFITLDFFSGSATTAHAVMQLNAEDGGNRKFIMVQLPEETAKDSEAFKAGYNNICEIGKDRIRRAGKKIKTEHPEAKGLDIGFRVLKCDESNFKPVAFAPNSYEQSQLDMFLDNIKSERTGLDLLFDCMMRWGLELSLPYTEQNVDGCTLYNVDEGSLVACFEGNVTEAVIDAIAQANPVRVVFRDSSFKECAEKMNLFELFKQKCGWTDEEVKNNVRVI